MEENDTTNESLIVKGIRDGTLENWYAVEMYSTLLGYEMTQDFMYRMLCLSNNEPYYTLLWNTLTEEDVMDRYFSDYSLISLLLRMHGREVYDSPNEIRVSSTKFDSLQMLKSLDVRNPKYLLRYFLHFDEDPSPGNKKTYYSLFYDIIHRTRIRSEKLHVFKDILRRLEEKYQEKKNIDRLMV